MINVKKARKPLYCAIKFGIQTNPKNRESRGFPRNKREARNEHSEGRGYPIAPNGGKDIEVAIVHEVKNDSVEGTLAFLESIGESVFSLL